MSKPLAASFAQMLGIRPKSKGSRAEDDEDKKDAKGSRAEDDSAEDDEEDKKGAKGSRAEDDDDSDAKGSRAEDDDEDGDDDKKAKGAKAEDEEDDDAADDEDKDKDSKATKAAKASERARCARIISHGIKCGRVEQAGVFAFDTGMSATAAISALDAAASVSGGKPQGTSLRNRMASVPDKNAGSDGASAASLSLADQIIQAGKIRRNEQ